MVSPAICRLCYSFFVTLALSVVGAHAQSYHTVRLGGLPSFSNVALPAADVWVPASVGPLRGTLFVFGGDGAADSSFQRRAYDAILQAWAAENGFAIVAADDNSTLIGSTAVSSNEATRNTNRARIDAATMEIARVTGRPELATAPILITGYSRGAFEASNWGAIYSERVIAFVGQRGLCSPASSAPFNATPAAPGLVLPGSRDNNSLTNPNFIEELATSWIADHRPLAVATAWGENHFGQFNPHSLELTLAFFDAIMKLRLPATPGDPLLPVTMSSGGWRGTRDEFGSGNSGRQQLDNSSFRQIAPADAYVAEGNLSASWLPDAAFAHAYRAYTSADGPGTDLNNPRTEYPKQSAPAITTSALTTNSTLDGLILATVGQSLTAMISPREFTGLHRVIWQWNGAEILTTTHSASGWEVAVSDLTEGLHILSATCENAAGTQRYAAFRAVLVRAPQATWTVNGGGSLISAANWSTGSVPFGQPGTPVSIPSIETISGSTYQPATLSGNGSALTLGSLSVGRNVSTRWIVFDSSAPLHFHNGPGTASLHAIIPTGNIAGGQLRSIRFDAPVTSSSPLEISAVPSNDTGILHFNNTVNTGTNPLRITATNNSARTQTFGATYSSSTNTTTLTTTRVEFAGPVTTSNLVLDTTINPWQANNSSSENNTVIRNHRLRVLLGTSNPGLTGDITFDQDGRGHSWANSLSPVFTHLDLNHAGALGTARLVTRDSAWKRRNAGNQTITVTQQASGANLTVAGGLLLNAPATLTLRGRPASESAAVIRIEGPSNSIRSVIAPNILVWEPGELVFGSHATAGTQRVVLATTGTLVGAVQFGEAAKPEVTTEVEFAHPGGTLSLLAPSQAGGNASFSITGGGEVELAQAPTFSAGSHVTPAASTVPALSGPWTISNGTLTVNNGRTTGHGPGTGAINLTGPAARLGGFGRVGKGTGQNVSLSSGARLRPGNGSGQGDLTFNLGTGGTLNLGPAPVLEIAFPSAIEIASGSVALPAGGLNINHFAFTIPPGLESGTYEVITPAGNGTISGALGAPLSANLPNGTQVVLRMESGSVVADVTVAPFRQFILAGVQVSGGNEDASLQANETATLRISLRNLGTTASGANATLTCTTPGITVLDPNLSLASVAPGAMATAAADVDIAPGLLAGTIAQFTLSVTHATGTDVIPFSLTIQPIGTSSVPSVLSVTTGGVITPGGTSLGNSGDDVLSKVPLPFAISFLGTTYAAGTNATIDSNGTLRFGDHSTSVYYFTGLPSPAMGAMLAPFWGDLQTNITGGGIFTLLSGTAPNRTWQIEWVTREWSPANRRQFAIRFYEGLPYVDFIYGALTDDAGNTVDSAGCVASIGLQGSGLGPAIQYSIGSDSVSEGMVVRYLIGNLPSLPPRADSDADGIPDWWTMQHFGRRTGQAGDLSRATDAPAGDGIANLMKYALGRDPHTPGLGNALRHELVTDESADYLSLTYTRPHPAPAGIQYTVEASSTLAPGSWVPVPPTEQILSGGTATITAEDTQPVNSTNPRRFLRLRVSKNP